MADLVIFLDRIDHNELEMNDTTSLKSVGINLYTRSLPGNQSGGQKSTS